jgi:NADH-quinone oxidoreductase subunit L
MLLWLLQKLFETVSPERGAALFNLNVLPWLILLLPLGGFVVLALFGDAIKRDHEQRGAGILACLTVLLSFDCAIWVAYHLNDEAKKLLAQRIAAGLPGRVAPEGVYEPSLFGGVFNLIDVASVQVPFALLLDRLTSVMMLVITGVGSLIHIYSLGYMAHDEERVRYFSYLNLFTFFMLVLVMGASLPLMFVGWEGVGLCSYLLIGFWYKKKSASDAGKKAFIVNRIGDAGLILGTIMAFYAFGSVGLLEITELARGIPAEATAGAVTAICLLLFLGACGKSAQIPLHVWLPDAMEGPTPVSALIHAATMVTAGVYMVARLAPLFMKAPLALDVVAVVGTATALMAATVALVQTDIKRVLAYSTVSQLGYMFLACGVGAFGVAVFHLVTHAFFKALLFLGSGSVIHAMSGEQDMRKMGGLAKKIPVTFVTFVIGTAAIAGIPGLAGFFSKDEILASALGDGRTILFAVGLLTALLTAFYMSRLLFMTFWGHFRGDHETEHHVHESPWTMLFPLCVLALGSIATGYIPIPHFVSSVFHLEEHAEHHYTWLQWGVAPAITVAGIALAYYLYVIRTQLAETLAVTFAPIRRVLEAKYYFDDVYNWFARRLVVDASSAVLWKAVDAGIIDGAVNGSATLVAAVARGLRFVQTGLVRAYALVIFGGAVALLSYLLWM